MIELLNPLATRIGNLLTPLNPAKASTQPASLTNPSLMVAIAILAIHAVISFGLYYNTAFIPDEIWFIEHVENQIKQIGFLNFNNVFHIENGFGYGSLYWFIHHIAFSIFGEPWLGIRLIYWFLLVLGDFLLLATIWKIDPKKVGLASLFLMTLPLTWWQGKITGSEPLSHVLLLAAIFFAVTTHRPTVRSILAGLFIGLSIGVKLSALPLLLFVMALLFWLPRSDQTIRKLKELTQISTLFLMMTVIGFVIANPFLLLSPSHFLVNLPPSISPSSSITAHISDILFGSRWLWEVVPIGSAAVFGASLPIIGIVLLIQYFGRTPIQIAIAFWMGFVGIIVLSLRINGFFGWYFYSVIMLLPLVISFGLHNRFIVSLLHVALIIFSAYANFAVINEMIQNKRDQISVLSEKDQIESHTSLLINRFSPGLIIDYSEYNLTPVQTIKSETLTNLDKNIDYVGVDDLRKLSSLTFLWNHYTSWVYDADHRVIACPKIDTYNNVMIVIGERLTRHKPPLDTSLRDWVERSFVNECSGWSLEYYDISNKIHYFVLRNSNTKLRSSTTTKLNPY